MKGMLFITMELGAFENFLTHDELEQGFEELDAAVKDDHSKQEARQRIQQMTFELLNIVTTAARNYVATTEQIFDAVEGIPYSPKLSVHIACGDSVWLDELINEDTCESLEHAASYMEDLHSLWQHISKNIGNLYMLYRSSDEFYDEVEITAGQLAIYANNIIREGSWDTCIEALRDGVPVDDIIA